MLWHTGNAHNGYAARGVHGQTVYIDPKAQMVIVRFATHLIAGNVANAPPPRYQRIKRWLTT